MNTYLLRSITFVRRYSGKAALAVLAVLVLSASELVAPQLLRLIVDEGISGGRADIVLRAALGLVAIATVGALAQFAQGYLSARISHGAAYDLRNTIFDRLQTLSFSYHDRIGTGPLVTRVTSDVDIVREFLGGGLVQAIAAAVLLIGATTTLLMMNWRLALVALVAVPATIFVLVRFVGGLGPMYRTYQQRLSALSSVLQENIAGVRVVKAFAREPYEAERYRTANAELLDQGMRVRRTVANAFPLLFSVGTAGVALVTWVGAVRIATGTLTVGELVAFTSYLGLLLQPLFTIGFGAQAIARAGASAERLFEVIDARSEVTERQGATALVSMAGGVEFVDVRLRYPGADGETLQGVSFAVEPGTIVAIVGATGSGKSSVVNLIPRFYDVTGGSVLIDGIDVRDLTLDSLRSNIGVVLQESVLFSGTVAENIAYGRPNATLPDIEAAATAAAAHDFIQALPDGYETRVGERGVRLSGGQRQRIAIARALLVDPAILIMDDSMSSVDATTEVTLRERLEALMRGRTTFIVAQRLATVRRADRVVLIDDGLVAAIGTHDELAESSCLYAQVIADQMPDAHGMALPQSCDPGGL
ncbi:MAG: ABC transporter ATP-binding protein [Coriobacteriia bacterium]